MNDYNMMNNITAQFMNPNHMQPMQPQNSGMQGQKNQIGSPKEGYTLGNLFVNTYIPYKNYTPQKLTARNEQEALFLKLSEMAFAAHELNLYLDLHPQDARALQVFNQYRMQTNELKTQYENQYGPLLISANVLENSPFLWEQLPFPWEGGR